jgi:phosphate transport system permease protein
MAAPDASPAALPRRRRRRPVEQTALLLLAASGVISILVTVGIVYTLASEGAGFFGDVPLPDFLTGTTWAPTAGEFGVLPLLWASVYIALMAALVAVPLGLGAAIYLSEYAHERVRRVIKPVLEVLAGMPTIVLGFFAITSVTPVLQDLGVLRPFDFFNALSAGIVVGVLITPLISSLSEDAMRAVPNAMREGAYGVGAGRRTVALRIVLPAALSGIMASIVLGLSRAIGETLAVTLAAGTLPNLTADPREQMQSITSVIVQISGGEATRGSVQYESIFAIGIVLFLVTLAINLVAIRLVRRFRTVYV